MALKSSAILCPGKACNPGQTNETTECRWATPALGPWRFSFFDIFAAALSRVTKYCALGPCYVDLNMCHISVMDIPTVDVLMALTVVKPHDERLITPIGCEYNAHVDRRLLTGALS